MKRAVMLLVAGALVVGSALSAQAQAPTVSFGGQMRIFGFVRNNVSDFKDSTNGAFRDSDSYYFQRFRLFTTIESADKKAKAFWALEIGDITWGSGGGASGGNYGCTGSAPTVPVTTGGVAGVYGTAGAGTRVGPSSGGCFGADGVNVETKQIWIWADTSGFLPGTSIQLGIVNPVFMTSPIGAFLDDDMAGIIVNWKMDPVDVQVWTAKYAEGANANGDDVDAYTLRVGVNLTKDMRLTLEGLVIDQRSLAGQSFGDNFWFGATFSAKLADVNLHASAIYGQRVFARAAGVPAGSPFEESGFGGFVSVQVPMGPLSVFGIVWYTTGDDTVGPANCAPKSTAGCGAAARTLTKDSDKLPLPNAGGSWFGGGGPYIAEFLFGNSSIGAPGAGQLQYADPTGTWGMGGSVSYALTPTFSVGGGVAYVGATDADGPYGSGLFEIDLGATYRFNANLILNLFAGYMIPESGDGAWGAAFRTQFSF
jgi:hypothetical protein